MFLLTSSVAINGSKTRTIKVHCIGCLRSTAERTGEGGRR
jgi:hypothetical protein